jgi:hypothetical protein
MQTSQKMLTLAFTLSVLYYKKQFNTGDQGSRGLLSFPLDTNQDSFPSNLLHLQVLRRFVPQKPRFTGCCEPSVCGAPPARLGVCRGKIT